MITSTTTTTTTTEIVITMVNVAEQCYEKSNRTMLSIVSLITMKMIMPNLLPKGATKNVKRVADGGAASPRLLPFLVPSPFGEEGLEGKA